MKAKTCFRAKELPDGGVRIKYFDIEWKDYEHLVWRPRWLMIATFIFFFTFFSLGVFIAGWPEETGGKIFSLIIVTGATWFSLWALYQILLPNRWRFLFAMGEKGILLRTGFICRSYWFYPWAEITGIEKVTRGHIPEQMHEVLTVYFKKAVVRYLFASFINVENTIKPLIEKYQLKKAVDIFPGEVRYGTLGEYDLGTFDAVVYKHIYSELAAFGFCLFFGAILAFLFYREDKGNLVYFLVMCMFFFVCLIKLKAMLTSKQKRFAFAIGQQGLLLPASKLLGKNETILIPWRIIDHAMMLPNHTAVWLLDINFVLCQTNNTSTPAEYLVQTYSRPHNQQDVLHALSKYCTIKP